MRQAVALPVALGVMLAAAILAPRRRAGSSSGALLDGSYVLVPDDGGELPAIAPPVGPFVELLAPPQLYDDAGQVPAADPGAVSEPGGFAGAVDWIASLITPMPRWVAALNSSGLAPVFAAASAAYAIPDGLLARVAWQESRYNVNAYNATSGAAGIMQIVQRWHPGVDPYDARAAIPYAAGYLRRLRDRFGSWALALCAYNWGEGNVQRAIDLAQTRDAAGLVLPQETRAYFRDVLADVNAWTGGGLA